MAIGGVMNGAVVAAAGAGLAVGDNRFWPLRKLTTSKSTGFADHRDETPVQK